MAHKIRGFSADARALLEEHPGLSAGEVYEALRNDGKAMSASKDPKGSLVATLHKYHRDMGLIRRKEGPVYRYYPIGLDLKSPSESQHHPSETLALIDVCIRMTRERVALLDGMLLADSDLHDRSDAANALLDRVLARLEN